MKHLQLKQKKDEKSLAKNTGLMLTYAMSNTNPTARPTFTLAAITLPDGCLAIDTAAAVAAARAALATCDRNRRHPSDLPYLVIDGTELYQVANARHLARILSHCIPGARVEIFRNIGQTVSVRFIGR